MTIFNSFKRQHVVNDSTYDVTERFQMSMIEDHLASPLRTSANDTPVAWLDAHSLNVVTDVAKQNMPYATAITYSTPLYLHPHQAS